MPDPLFALILEDRLPDFELVARELKRAGFAARCERAENEEEYRAKLLADPDVILSDYVLPGFGALHALKLLQESCLDIPFIVLTGVVSEETVVECMKKGAADYLLKDRLARLGPAVRRALEENEVRRQKRAAEEALRKCNARFQHLWETTKVIPWEFDRETGRFIYVGAQAVALLGHPLETWYHEGFWSAHVYPEDQDALFLLRRKHDAASKDRGFICRMLARDGDTIWLHCVVGDSDTRVLRGFMMDITELKTRHESLVMSG